MAIGIIDSSGGLSGFGWTEYDGRDSLILDTNTGINYSYLAYAIVF